jgi:hypothetical protein
MTLNQPLPALVSSVGNIDDAYSWAIQLANGERCAALLGTGSEAAASTSCSVAERITA